MAQRAVPVTDRTAWLEWRRQGIGASDAAAIAGLDPYRGPMSIWLDKTGRLPLDAGDQTEYRKWGNLLEPAIADEFEQRTGLAVTDRGIWRFNADYSWMRATIDGLVVDSRPPEYPLVALGVLEIKTVAGFKSPAWAEEVPEHFQIQVQHQLAVTGHERAWLAVLFGGQRMEIYELERDDDLIGSLIHLEDAFWTKHVLADVPPAADGTLAATDDLRRAFAAGGGQQVDLPEDAEAWIEVRARAKAVVDEAEKERALAEQALMAMLGEAEVGLLGGRPRVTWKRQERQEYTVKAASYRVLRIVGTAGAGEEHGRT